MEGTRVGRAIPGGEALITRHEPIDRVFHWITALAVLLLLASAAVPRLGLDLSWLPVHWVTGVVLSAAVAFHVLRATFARSLRRMFIRPRHLLEHARGVRAGKYTLPQKLMHAVLGLAVLVACVTGALLLARLDTVLWPGAPYLLEPRTWGAVGALHGAASLCILALGLAHAIHYLRPSRRAYLRAMIRGQMTRDEAAALHDPARWSGQRKNDPHENGG
jgi:cytochrome b subunit of formate dehydrogenase